MTRALIVWTSCALAIGHGLLAAAARWWWGSWWAAGAVVAIAAVASGWARSELGRRQALRDIRMLVEDHAAQMIEHAPEEMLRRARAFAAEEAPRWRA